MKTLESLVPALLTFGPIMMVIGLSGMSNTVGTMIAYAGALMLSAGGAYLFRQVVHLRDSKRDSEK